MSMPSNGILRSIPSITLTDEELRSLLVKAKEGDEQARLIILRSVIRRVIFLAQRYARPDILDDLIQEGSMAVMKAIDAFNPDQAKGCSFVTYASFWAKSYMMSFIRKDVTVRTSERPCYVSLDEPFSDDDDRVLHETMQSPDAPPDLRYQIESDSRTVRVLLDCLKEHERDAVEAIFGIGREAETANGYGRRHHRSGMAIIYRVRGAVEKLRRAMVR